MKTNGKGWPRGDWVQDPHGEARLLTVPEFDTPVPPCLATCAVYLCTLPDGHRSRHVATAGQRDGLRRVVAVWR